jgi:putative DNA primase/helicase
MNHWVLWRYLNKSGKWSKVPYQPCGSTASSTDARTWTSFEDVIASYLAGGYDGVGIVLDGAQGGDGLTLAAVDIDKAIDNPGRQARAQQIIASMDSYTELSPSGQGYRIFLRARPLLAGVNRDGFEVYTSGRYLTVTGHVVGEFHA